MNRRDFISEDRLPRVFENIHLNQVWRWKATPDAQGSNWDKWGFVILSEVSVGGKWMVLDVIRSRTGHLYRSVKRDKTMPEDDIYRMSLLQYDIKGEDLKTYIDPLLSGKYNE